MWCDPEAGRDIPAPLRADSHDPGDTTCRQLFRSSIDSGGNPVGLYVNVMNVDDGSRGQGIVLAIADPRITQRVTDLLERLAEEGLD